MFKRFKSQKFKSMLPFFVLAVAVIIAYQVISEVGVFFSFIGRIWGIVTPFFYGFLIAYILDIPRNGIQKLLEKTRINFVIKRKKVLSIISVYILLALILALILNWIIPVMFRSITSFVSALPTHYENILEIINYINSLDLFGLYISVDHILNSLQEWVQDFDISNLLLPINALVGVGTAVFNTFIALISSVYILIEKDRFKAFLGRVLKTFTPVEVFNEIIKYSSRLNNNFKKYIYAQTIDGLILGSIATVLLYIMGSPYALVLGIMLGILNYIPYFGSITGTIIAIAVVAFTQGVTMGAVSAVVLLITQQIDANIIQPKLMSGSFKLSPLLVIISITVGGAFAGILGMIAVIPIVAVLKDILENIIKYYERKKEETQSEQEDV